jgi:hypothetical protein
MIGIVNDSTYGGDDNGPRHRRPQKREHDDQAAGKAQRAERIHEKSPYAESNAKQRPPAHRRHDETI